MARKKEKKRKLVLERLVVIITVTVELLSVTDSIPTKEIGGRKRRDLVVEFNPYVSILDKYNRYRYNMTDLVSMVRTIATEFDKVLIAVGDVKTNNQDGNKQLKESIFLCASAVAIYNNERDGSLPKVEVWLASVSTRNDTFTLVSNMADEANRIHNGTVTTIVYEASLYLSRNRHIRTLYEASRKTYKVGMGVSRQCYVDQLEAMEDARPDFILLPAQDQDWIPKIHEGCNISRISKFTDIVYSFTTSDTYANGKVNMTGLVRKWNAWRKIADEGVASVMIAGAFDTPYNDFPYSLNGQWIQFRTRGWWRLKENASFPGAVNYIFEAKNLIAEKFDMEENCTDLTQIKTFSKNHSEYVGVILQIVGSDARSGIPEYMLGKHIEQILELVDSKHSKVVLLLPENSKDYYQYIYGLSVSKYTKGTKDIILLFQLKHRLSRSLIDLSYHLSGFAEQTLIFDFDTHEFTAHQNLSSDIFLKQMPRQKGYSFPIKYCTTFPLMSDSNKSAFLNALKESDVAVFYFAEDEAVVSLGARRMFEDRIVQFEECRRFLTKINENRNMSGQVGLIFLMLHYAHPLHVYKNPMALYNFVLYWKMVAAWAEDTKTTVIMNNADDGRRDYNGRTYLELGWWRAYFSKNDKIMDYIDKEADLRQLLPEPIEQPQQLPTPLSMKDIFLISGAAIIVVIVIIFVVVIVILRKRWKKNYLSGTEQDKFFNGTNDLNNAYPCRDVQCLPYDKSRFEIEPKSFSIDHKKSLGSGEFGLVCASRVEKSPGVFLDAAVKMVNSAKFHKSTLTGLLSEIKVLAYLGKHDNLIELLGASTAELKHGKVFVFLELCSLGSLEKYIRALCPPPTDNLETENGVELTDMHNYANATAQFSCELDPSLSVDLYRWSKQICSGMSFLASKHVVHADLATRNVLLSQEKTAKICDFGLSRRMYNYASYVKQHQEPIPWKWMPPESLRRMEFNEKSDVWAYGVTLWEMYSLGDTPYPGLSWAPNFFQMLERGFRMSQPKYVERNIWAVIEECWRTSSDARPTFAELLSRFPDISEDVA